MARFWLPLYSAVILSMYAYGTFLSMSTSCMRLTIADCCAPFLVSLDLTCIASHLSVRPHGRFVLDADILLQMVDMGAFYIVVVS